MVSVALAFAVLLAWTAPACAEQFTSATLGFSAEFPASPVVHPEQDAARDPDGRVLSRASAVQTGIAHVYSAVVVVESFSGPLPAPVDKLLTDNRDDCLQGWDITITSSDPVMQDGHRALAFRYAARSGGGGGAGIVAVVEGERPRVYVLFTMYTPKADAETVAALERMVRSFHIH